MSTLRNAMRKKSLVLCGLVMAALFLTSTAAIAQDKNIRLVKGRKLVLKGEVPDGQDRSYFFKARPGQNLTVKLIGRDAVFMLFAQHNFDAEEFSEETKAWSGRLPRADSGEYAIRLSSNYKVASYMLEILLR